MSNNFFAQGEENENEEFRDIPEEVVEGNQAPIPQVKVNRPAGPIKTHSQILQEQVKANVDQAYEEAQEEYEEVTDEEEDFSAVLNDARFRLEQGRLYEMIMNHNVFDGADADEKAIKYVTKQIRNFAKEQMEIMLGMRQEQSKAQALTASDFPFNDLEVQTLRALASAATKGATASPEAQSFSGVQAAPRKAGLNTISVKSQPRQAAPQPKAQQRPLQQKPQAPVKRTRTEIEIDRILAEEGITREEYERTFDPNYKPLSKRADQISEAELKERARQVVQKNPGQVKNPSAIPMPTAEQEEMLYSQRAQTAAAHPQMQGLMNLLLTQQKK